MTKYILTAVAITLMLGSAAVAAKIATLNYLAALGL